MGRHIRTSGLGRVEGEGIILQGCFVTVEVNELQTTSSTIVGKVGNEVSCSAPSIELTVTGTIVIGHSVPVFIPSNSPLEFLPANVPLPHVSEVSAEINCSCPSSTGDTSHPNGTLVSGAESLSSCSPTLQL